MAKLTRPMMLMHGRIRLSDAERRVLAIFVDGAERDNISVATALGFDGHAKGAAGTVVTRLYQASLLSGRPGRPWLFRITDAGRAALSSERAMEATND